MERIAILVPIFTQSLVTTVFHGPHRVLFAFVDIQHLAAVLCLIDVQHLTTADSTSTVWVVFVADSLQFQHVLAADALVATLIEEY